MSTTTKQQNELVTIQSRLKAPKSQFNKFGGYRYRSCEDILEAVKPLLLETGCTLTISDDVVAVGNRIYIRATATLVAPGGKEWETTALAREADTKKGMDDSQITGTASSYARKYALNGLFAIDDCKDADTLNNNAGYTQQQVQPQRAPQPQQPQPVAQAQPQPVDALDITAKVLACTTGTQLLSLFNSLSPADQQEYKALFTQRKKKIA